MMYYETMYIVHPALESGRLKDLIISIEQHMHTLGGATCAINVWGKKKLAYPINKEKYGMYILLQFKSDGSFNKDFNTSLDHNSNVLSYLTTKIDEETVLLDLPNLDEQLGLSNSSNNQEKKSIESNTPLVKKSENDDSSIDTNTKEDK